MLARLLLPILVCTCLLGLAVPAAGAATVMHVRAGAGQEGDGSAEQPFRTIGEAVAIAREDDVILVHSGTYRETVELTSQHRGVALRGVGGSRPVIDGENERLWGLSVRRADDVRFENFEVTSQVENGVRVYADGFSATGNYVHGIGSHGTKTCAGFWIATGSGNAIRSNIVHSIGPGGECIGIWLLQARDSAVSDNVVYLVRKEGIRDWMGLNNRITDNRVFLNWAGISLATSTGSLVMNNYVYDNVEGLVAKHTSHARVLAHWMLDRGHWSRFWHNTVFRSTEASVWIAQSGAPMDYLDVRNNIFHRTGAAYVRDAPEIRGDHVVVDGNLYGREGRSGQPPMYEMGWSDRGGLTSLAGYRSALGWESSGMRFRPPLADPAAGDLDYPDSSRLARGSLPLDSPLGRQLGARGLSPASVRWTPYAMRAVDSSSRGTWWTKHRLRATADGDHSTYWLTESNRNEHVTYDLGRRRRFNTAVLAVYRHEDPRNTRRYRFEYSKDGRRWRPLLEGANPDAAGSSYKYAFPKTIRARFLRYTMIDSFCKSDAERRCDEYFVLSDLAVGLLARRPD